MSDPHRLRQYETFKRENDEHLLISLNNLFPHEDSTDTVRANIALEIYGQKFTIAHLMREWTERHREVERIYSDVNGIPSAKLDDHQAIRKAALVRQKDRKTVSDH